MDVLRVTVCNGKVQVSLLRENGDTMVSAPPAPFYHPFDKTALEEISWYVEDYIDFPYGAASQRAELLLRSMPEWGGQLYKAVFCQSTRALAAYHEVVRFGLHRCELVVASDDSSVLGLPWELIYDAGRGYLVFSLATIYRSLINISVDTVPSLQLLCNQLNILIVTSRPYGERDAPFGMIAHPLLEAIHPLGSRAHFMFLRPSTFNALDQELMTNRRFYCVVHFDGHVVLNSDTDEPEFTDRARNCRGFVFEDASGGVKEVSVECFAKSLQNGGVPIVILSSWKRAQLSSLAHRLIAQGVRAVVAMAYSVHASAACEFMSVFYAELAKGTAISDAVALGRRQMRRHAKRPSLKGDILCQDWMIPVLFQKDHRFSLFDKNNSVGNTIEISRATRDLEADKPFDFPNNGRHSFVGRDLEVLRLERYFQDHHLVVLRGTRGVGKTELACGWARWLLKTEGRSLVLYMSFGGGTDLSSILSRVGRRCGLESSFTQWVREEEQERVIQYLRQNRCLLIWDNFERFKGLPEDGRPWLSAQECARVSGFLDNLAGGKSWVLIISQRKEEWLGCRPKFAPLRGLVMTEAVELTRRVLRQGKIGTKRLSSGVWTLLQLLEGHPLCFRFVLPRLADQSPEDVEAELRALLRDTAMEEEGGSPLLLASLKFSFLGLSGHARRHLPFLGLLSDWADATRLGAFSGTADDEDGKAYFAVFRETLNEGEWFKVLSEAAKAGLVEKSGLHFFHMHPVLPRFLRRELKVIMRTYGNADSSDAGAHQALSQLERCLVNLYAAISNCELRKIQNENSGFALGVLHMEEANMLQQLRRAAELADWAAAQIILQALNEMYNRTERCSEFDVLRSWTLRQLSGKWQTAKSRGPAAFELWIFLKGEEAEAFLRARRLEQAQRIYFETLEELKASNYPSGLPHIAVAYHQLGIIAQEKQLFHEAKEYFQQSLKIVDDVGDLSSAAKDNHHLGVIAQQLHEFGDAKTHFSKALRIYHSIGDMHCVGREYLNLGMVAKEQLDFEVAKKLYTKALEIFDEGGDLPSTAVVYNNLGILAYWRGAYAAAVILCWKARWLFCKLEDQQRARGSESNLAGILHKLGEEEFKNVWRKHLEQECPESLLCTLKAVAEDVE